MIYEEIDQSDILERCRMKESQNNDCSESKDKSRSGDSTVHAAIIEKRARYCH